MPNQLTLAFTVKVANTSYGPVKAAVALAAVPLYANLPNDPVLGQFLGLTVASDVTTTPTASTAVRTVVLNMTSVPGVPTAPPPSPCNPITATPPVPPYPLLTTNPLPGNFLTIPGSPIVGTSDSQVPSLVGGSVQKMQFLAQPGVFYTVLTVASGSITLTTNYTGPFSEDDGAVLMVPAPAKIVAVYSTSPLDSAGVAITPALPAGSGARTMSLSYLDSTGAGPFTVVVSLTGTYPSLITLHAGSVDIATITDLHIATTGGFGNSVGQITLCELSAPPPYVRANADTKEFQDLVDQTQLLITRGLVYLPPSYFALSQQGASEPPLVGEFLLPGRLASSSDFPLTLGGTSVATTVDQASVSVTYTAETGLFATGDVVTGGTSHATGIVRRVLDNGLGAGTLILSSTTGTFVGAETLTAIPSGATATSGTVIGPALSAGNTLVFAADPNSEIYTVKAVGQGNITLTTPYRGLNDNPISSSATLITPSPAVEPTNTQLSGPVGEFVNPGTAVPPPQRPLAPQTMSPSPTFLSGMFARTLQLALAVPVVPSAIVLS